LSLALKILVKPVLPAHNVSFFEAACNSAAPRKTICSVIERRFREIVALYAGAIRRLCAAYARDPADREDLFQDILLAIWKALPGFRGDSSERTWLYRVAHNVALTWQSRDRRTRDQRRDLDEARMQASEPPDARRAVLVDMVARLSPVDRQLVILWLEGLSMPEIEEVSGIRAGTVAVRLTRIRKRLAEMIGSAEVRNG
jgi:RNA polymerase sigma factor (sigma-70 family)